MTPPLLQSSLRVVSAGAALFADTVAGQGVPVEQVYLAKHRVTEMIKVEVARLEKEML